MRLRVAFAMPVRIFARHDSLELREHIGSNVGIPVLGNDHRGGGMRDEEIAQPASGPDFSKRMIDFVGDVDQLDARLCFDLEVDHIAILACSYFCAAHRSIVKSYVALIPRFKFSTESRSSSPWNRAISPGAKITGRNP